jgi:hypothetical protein
VRCEDLLFRGRGRWGSLDEKFRRGEEDLISQRGDCCGCLHLEGAVNFFDGVSCTGSRHPVSWCFVCLLVVLVEMEKRSNMGWKKCSDRIIYKRRLDRIPVFVEYDLQISGIGL